MPEEAYKILDEYREASSKSNFNTKRTIKDVYTLKNVDINGLRTYELN